jgi:2-polyprenyl-6-methoxyphenol hydroxylase-like FAD-dependent oxidoreductase
MLKCARTGLGRVAGAGLAGLSAAAAFGVAGCIPVQVQAPDRPIEINLNVNIRQEVVVRLEREAQALLEENPDLF